MICRQKKREKKDDKYNGVLGTRQQHSSTPSFVPNIVLTLVLSSLPPHLHPLLLPVLRPFFLSSFLPFFLSTGTVSSPHSVSAVRGPWVGLLWVTADLPPARDGAHTRLPLPGIPRPRPRPRPRPLPCRRRAGGRRGVPGISCMREGASTGGRSW